MFLQQVSGAELQVQTTLVRSRVVTVKWLEGFFLFWFSLFIYFNNVLFLLSPSFEGVCCLNRFIVFEFSLQRRGL